jgi:two-component system, sensor histidine kinase and response regulator
MQGRIGVHSSPGKGSTFWFTAELEKRIAGAEFPEPTRYDLDRLRVLVVDDNGTNRQILRHQLTAWKMLPESAASGQEALRMLRTAATDGLAYNLALLDVQMPEMDGFTLARSIRADPAIAGTKLIALTSLGQALTAQELKDAGVEAYLIKPVKQSRLFNCLVNAVGKITTENFLIPSTPLPAASSPEVTANLKKPRILLAEDNLINQTVALRQLQKLGYAADAVTNGLEVLAALERLPYDIILMDCHMSEMDGYETARAIRQREAKLEQRCLLKSPVHIIAVTADAMQGDAEKCLAVGMNDYLAKPVRLTDLQAALERWQPSARIDRSSPSADDPACGADMAVSN